MAENEDQNTESEGELNLEEEKKGKWKGKRLLLMIGLAVIVILVPLGLYLTGMFSKKSESHAPTSEVSKEGGENAAGNAKPSEVYLELEEFLVNLNSAGKQPSFLKMRVVLEVTDSLTLPEIQKKMPRIRDSFQVYLRDLRSEDLQGAAGIYRLREELLLRLNKTLYPLKINDILFKEILVQ